MGNNTFGNQFKITTWGESHGKAIGVVIDGCPAGIQLTTAIIQKEVDRRKPGQVAHTSPRQEEDQVELLSGVFNDVTTGAPISILIWNRDHDSSKYESVKHLYKPGHANYTYLEKYGVFDYRGGGRASARETACRVAAAAVAKALLNEVGISVLACLEQVGEESFETASFLENGMQTDPNNYFCHDATSCEKVVATLEKCKQAGDSVGAAIFFTISGKLKGIGEPVYSKIEAQLASAMLSIPASKGFEIGEGFDAAAMHGSAHNDSFAAKDGDVQPETNRAGGCLGGIATGETIYGRVAFKPTSSIVKTQKTTDLIGRDAQFALPEGSRHDPCVGIRAVPVVEAMAALVIADLYLTNRMAKI